MKKNFRTGNCMQTCYTNEIAMKESNLTVIAQEMVNRTRKEGEKNLI